MNETQTTAEVPQAEAPAEALEMPAAEQGGPVDPNKDKFNFREFLKDYFESYKRDMINDAEVWFGPAVEQFHLNNEKNLGKILAEKEQQSAALRITADEAAEAAMALHAQLGEHVGAETSAHLAAGAQRFDAQIKELDEQAAKAKANFEEAKQRKEAFYQRRDERVDQMIGKAKEKIDPFEQKIAAIEAKVAPIDVEIANFNKNLELMGRKIKELRATADAERAKNPALANDIGLKIDELTDKYHGWKKALDKKTEQRDKIYKPVLKAKERVKAKQAEINKLEQKKQRPIEKDLVRGAPDKKTGQAKWEFQEIENTVAIDRFAQEWNRRFGGKLEIQPEPFQAVVRAWKKETTDPVTKEEFTKILIDYFKKILRRKGSKGVGIKNEAELRQNIDIIFETINLEAAFREPEPEPVSEPQQNEPGPEREPEPDEPKRLIPKSEPKSEPADGSGGAAVPEQN